MITVFLSIAFGIIISVTKAENWAWYLGRQELINTCGWGEGVERGIPKNWTFEDKKYVKTPITKLQLDITQIQGTVERYDISGAYALAEPNKSIIHYSNLTLVILFRFNYGDQMKPGETGYRNGSGSIRFDTDINTMDVTYGLDASGKPTYTVASNINFKYPPWWNISEMQDEKIRSDVQKFFAENATDFPLQVHNFINEKLGGYMTQYYLNRANEYVLNVPYSFAGKAITNINQSITSLKFVGRGIQYTSYGYVQGADHPATKVPDFDVDQSDVQVAVTKEFFTEMAYVAESLKNFIWSFNSTNIAVKGFDFRGADLWMIFPESRDIYSATTRTQFDCQSDRDVNPYVNFDVGDQIVQVVLAVKCGLSMVDSKDKILNLSVPMVFDLDLKLTLDGKASVRIADSRLQKSCNVSMLTDWEFGTREQAIIDALVREGMEAYDVNHFVLGSGVPVYRGMTGFDYTVVETAVFAMGDVDPPPQPNGTRTRGEQRFLSEVLGKEAWKEHRRQRGRSYAAWLEKQKTQSS